MSADIIGVVFASLILVMIVLAISELQCRVSDLEDRIKDHDNNVSRQ